MALEQNVASVGGIAGPAITIVGCGPGSLEYLTPAARNAIEAADVLLGAFRLLELFPDVSSKRIVVGANIPQALDQLAPHIGQRRVAVLVSGDPGICSLAQPVIHRFGLPACHVIPGVSSVQVAFARLGLDWTDARIISAHHHVPDLDLATLTGEAKIALLAGNASNMPWVGELATHLTTTHTMFVCSDLTLPHEEVGQVGAAELATRKLSPQTILLFIGKKIPT